MSTSLVIAASIGIFGIFMIALAYGQMQTRGMLAPGAKVVE